MKEKWEETKKKYVGDGMGCYYCELVLLVGVAMQLKISSNDLPSLN